MQLFFQQLVNGLSWGAIYALIAVGYTMVYGVLRLINFAHGDVYMIGAMSGWLIAAQIPFFHHESWTAILLILLSSMAICGLLGFVIELVAYRPLRNRPRITALITAIGVSMFLEYGGQKFFGPDPQAFPALIPGLVDHPVLCNIGILTIGKTKILVLMFLPRGVEMTIPGVIIDKTDVLVIGVALAIMILLRWIVMKTRAGMALRAVSFRFDTAALMGINVNRTISFAFVLGSALAGVAGVLVAVSKTRIDPLMGLLPGLKAFVAAVLGGIGNIPGALLGGFLLGLTEVFVAGYFPHGSQYRDGVAFVILIVVLLIKPSGLLGSHVTEKV